MPLKYSSTTYAFTFYVSVEIGWHAQIRLSNNFGVHVYTRYAF